ncbi:putative mitochondrial protein AtMg00310 [Apium graveolens]|uniref:putative mitochondrial protein AtMg00310 n=1 Tax=Apium graveolens TaxID=4045 RepID=UPI003D7C0AF7
MPNYAMFVFLLPTEMCKQIENMMCKYWWKSGKKEKGIHWMSWERMDVSKSHGGMGFRHLHEFNIALLGKQGRQLVTHPNSLVARIFKTKYFPGDSFLTANLGTSPSFIWRSILLAQQILRQGLSRRVGDGSTVKIKNEPWLPDEDNPYITTETAKIENHTVSALMVPNERKWDEDLVKDVFNQRDANLILATPLSENSRDSWFWRKDKLGNYPFKMPYILIQESKPLVNQCGNTRFWKRVWNLSVPPKAKNFMWRAIMGCLSTKDMLRIK